MAKKKKEFTQEEIEKVIKEVFERNKDVFEIDLETAENLCEEIEKKLVDTFSDEQKYLYRNLKEARLYYLSKLFGRSKK